jgi:hypothetical protein
MGSLEKRLVTLEGRVGPKPQRSPAQELERETIMAELRLLEERHGTIREVAEREAEEGFPQRLRALVELERHVEKRLSVQGGAGEK